MNMKNKSYFFLVLFLLSFTANAQKMTVSGFVKDIIGISIPGVSVVEKGTDNGTVTNIDGKYEIRINKGHSLVFSFIGFSTQEKIIHSESLFYDIILNESSKDINEIVVTALGIKRQKKSLGYSVQEININKASRVKQANIAGALTGKIAGLSIQNKTGLFETPDIILRGKHPLIVVNGIPSSTNLYSIPADDIEKISVLKGVSASALYGSQGKDGAIIIVTKTGGKGKSEIVFTTNNSFQLGFLRIPNPQSKYGNGTAGKYAYIDGKGAGSADADGWIWGPELDKKDPNTGSGYMETTQWDSPIDAATGKRIPTAFVSKGRNNLRNFLRPEFITSNNLSISVGDKKGGARFSLSHMYQKGQVPNTSLKITSFSVSGNYELSDRLSTDASLSYTREYTDNYPRRGYGAQNYLYNLLLWTGADIDTRQLRDYWKEDGKQQKNYIYKYYNNPWFQAYENTQHYVKNSNYGYFKLGYAISENINLMLRTGIDIYNVDESTKTPKSFIDYSSDRDGNYDVKNAMQFNSISDILLNVRKSLASKFNINTNIGASVNWSEKRNYESKTDGLNIPGLYSLENTTNPTISKSMITEKQINSLYATFEVSYDDALFLNATARNDWSSALPKENNSFFYPSVSLSSVVSKLVNLPEQISFLKFRTSWARVSNDLAAYQISPSYGVSPTRYYDSKAYNGLNYPGTLNNRLIHPETSTSIEFGTDIRFYKNRIGLDFTYFEVEDKNDIINYPVSLASGFNYKKMNANKYKRSGCELSLKLVPVFNNKFKWDMKINASTYKRTLSELPEGQSSLNGVKPGQRMDIIRGTQFLRTKNGDIIYDKGLPTRTADKKILAYSNPDFIFGIGNTFKYKNISLNIFVDGRIGGSIYSQTIAKMWWGGTHPGTVNKWREDYANSKINYIGDGVIANGDNYTKNNIPVSYQSWVNSYKYRTDESNIFDASFIKLREISVNYSLPSRYFSNFIKAINVSLTAHNIAMWSKIKMIDPDTGSGELQTPSPRTFGFEIKIKI